LARSTQEVVREYLKSTISQEIVVLDERAIGRVMAVPA
jgi:hypothetical protein